MKVKLLRDGLYGGLVNRSAGEVVELDDILARDVALRGDGLLVTQNVSQIVPAFGYVEYPSITEEELAAETEAADPAVEPVEAPKVEAAAESVVEPVTESVEAPKTVTKTTAKASNVVVK